MFLLHFDPLVKEVFVFARSPINGPIYRMQIGEPINDKQKTGHLTSWKSVREIHQDRLTNRVVLRWINNVLVESWMLTKEHVSEKTNIKIVIF